MQINLKDQIVVCRVDDPLRNLLILDLNIVTYMLHHLTICAECYVVFILFYHVNGKKNVLQNK